MMITVEAGIGALERESRRVSDDRRDAEGRR